MNGNEIFYIQIDKSTFFYVVVFTITLQFSNLSDILRRTFAYIDLRVHATIDRRLPTISKPFDSPSSPIFDREKRAWISASDYRLQEWNNDSFVNLDNACGPE